MPTERSSDSPAGEGPSPAPDDDFLIASMLGGDAAALTRLIDRYDRLIRFTVFRSSKDRCLQDPEWLEGVASATWAGFVRSMRRDPDHRPRSLRAYLVQIAKNQVVSGLRAAPPQHQSLWTDVDGTDPAITSRLEEPLEILSRLELLEALRGCLAELGPDDRALATQLPAITERRWKDAAEALDLKESTLRSRWQQTLERLRGCIRRKTRGESFAPGGSGRDQ